MVHKSGERFFPGPQVWDLYPSVRDSEYTMYKSSENSCWEQVYFFNPVFPNLIWVPNKLAY